MIFSEPYDSSSECEEDVSGNDRFLTCSPSTSGEDDDRDVKLSYSDWLDVDDDFDNHLLKISLDADKSRDMIMLESQAEVLKKANTLLRIGNGNKMGGLHGLNVVMDYSHQLVDVLARILEITSRQIHESYTLPLELLLK